MRAGARLRCPTCRCTLKSAKSMVRHLMSAHDVDWDLIAGTWLAEEAFAVECEMTEQEFNAVMPHGEDPDRVICKLCGGDIGFNTCLLHFVKKHNTPYDDVKTWLVVKDANKVRNASHTRCFARSYMAYEQWLEEAGAAAEDDLIGDVAGEVGGDPIDESPFDVTGFK